MKSLRKHIPLSGKWSLRVGEDTFEAGVPSAWETMLGYDFDGSGSYHTIFPTPQLEENQRLILHFDAVSTHALVYVNDIHVCSHTGGWTPFECDITNVAGNTENILRVDVDEDLHHVTRGFNSTAMPHAGGIWQDACLIIRGSNYIKTPVNIIYDMHSRSLLLECDVSSSDGFVCTACVSDKKGKKVIADQSTCVNNGKAKMTLDASGLEPWSPENPALYDMCITLQNEEQPVDYVEETFGCRDISHSGRRILLNGRPIYPRGWLTWGVYPEKIAPAPTREEIRKEFRDAKALGFNMVKNCLWLPPSYYYDIADEMGMLIWLEYPTWQTTHLFGEDSREEFDELFLRDRNHPSVIIRSLTCEAKINDDPRIDRKEFDYLYNRAHELIGNTLVIDNSGFLLHWTDGYTAVSTDAYSDHPYLDCQDFPAHLDRLEERLAKLPERPFLTGESMDCDTWRDTAQARKVYGDDLPFWLSWDADNKPAPLCLVDYPTQEKRERKIASILPDGTLENIIGLSYKHALSHLKYQVETYRKRDLFTGYTLIGIRDSVGNTPGFYDDFGRLKHSPKETLGWNADDAVLVATEHGHFNFISGTTARLSIISSLFSVTHDTSARLDVLATCGKESLYSLQEEVSCPAGKASVIESIDVELPECGDCCVVDLRVRITLEHEKTVENEWKLYVFPQVQHPQITVTDNPDKSLAAKLANGENAIIIATPDNGIPVRPMQIWRESVSVFAEGRAMGRFPHDGYIDVQFLPLSNNFTCDTGFWEEHASPLVLRVNPRTYLYGADILETRVGKGKLIVCSYNCAGEDNFTANYLIAQLAKYVESSDCSPKKQMDENILAQLFK